MFRILFQLMKDQDIIGLPFYLQRQLQKNTPDDKSRAVLVIPKEGNMADKILLELSDIYDTCRTSKDLNAVLRQFANHYCTYSLNLLDKGKTEEFRKFTAWYSKCIKTSHPQLRFSDIMVNKHKGDYFEIEWALSGFRKELYARHKYAIEIFDIYMRADPHSSEA